MLEWREGRPVYLRDVAQVSMEMVDVSNMLTSSGKPALAFFVIPETGVNVYDVMDGVKATVADLSANELDRAGLEVQQSSDNTIYITRSVGMVRNNLVLGVSLAIGVLWWFLRKFRATLIVALSIPLCGMIAFMVLDFAGRTLNIISLAGLAFATGMVLDAAIVVLENIFRQREQGHDGDEASLRGVSQVWGALLASTATTVALRGPPSMSEISPKKSPLPRRATSSPSTRTLTSPSRMTKKPLPLKLRFNTSAGSALPIPARNFTCHTVCMRPVVSTPTAFSTSSSMATLPTSIATAEQKLDVQPKIAGFVLPLGATMNMNGTSLFEGVTVLFLAQVFGVDLSIGSQIIVVILAVLTAIGAAGVPGGSLPLMMLVMATVGVPPEGIAIILGVDRILDMSRTAVNVWSDSCGAVVVASTENETDILAARVQLDF